MTTRILRTLFRSFFYFYCFLLWVGVCILALELFAFAFEKKMERSNPLITAYIDSTENKAAISDAIINDAPTFYPDQIGGWEKSQECTKGAPLLAQAIEGSIPATTFDSESRQQQRLLFSEFSPYEKELYARLHGEAILLVDKGFNIHAVFGADKRRYIGSRYLLLRLILYKSGQLGKIHEAIAQTLKQQYPQSCHLYLPDTEKTLESLSIIFMPAPESDYAYAFSNIHPESIYGPPVTQPDQDSHWEVPFFRYKRNFSQAQDPSFQTNSRGFRNAEIPYPKPEDTFRILCVGASTTDTLGEGQQNYPMRLEQLLYRAFPDSNIEVINGGTPGIASDGHLLRIDDYISTTPDLVILHLGVNDTIKYYNDPLTNLPARFSRFIRLFAPGILSPSLTEFKKILEDNTELNLKILAEQFQCRGVAVAFASMPFPDPDLVSNVQRQYLNYQAKRAWAFPAFALERYAGYIRNSNTLLRELSQEVQAIYVPLAESMATNTAVYKDFCHMKQPGINAKAQIIFESIRPVVKKRIASKVSPQEFNGEIKETP